MTDSNPWDHPDVQDYINDLLENASDEYDDDVAASEIALRYVRDLEAAVRECVLTHGLDRVRVVAADPAPTDPEPDGEAITDFYRRVVEWRTCLDSDGAWTLLDDALSLLGVDPDALVPTEFLPAADPATTDPEGEIVEIVRSSTEGDMPGPHPGDGVAVTIPWSLVDRLHAADPAPTDPDAAEADMRSVLNLGAGDDDAWRDVVTDQMAALRANRHIVAAFLAADPAPTDPPDAVPCPRCGQPRPTHTAFLTCSRCGLHDEDWWLHNGPAADPAPTDPVTHVSTYTEDDGGWVVVSCSCGFRFGPVPDMEIAADVWGDHRSTEGGRS